jgi:hypothetical protein
MTVSVRSCLVASLAAATLSTVAVVPVPTPRADALNLPAIELTAAVLPLIQPAAAITAAVAPAATAAAVAAAIATPKAAQPIAAVEPKAAGAELEAEASSSVSSM